MKKFKKITWGLIGGLIILSAASCEKSSLEEQQITPNEVILGDENANYFEGPIPEATVPIKEFSSTDKNLYKAEGTEESTSTLTATIEATLRPEESHEQTLTGTISGGPSVGDMMFVMDLTGSMGGELANAKNNSINIMNSIRGLIPNTNFGLISHMDYNTFFTSCGYSTTYGSSGDYPYMLNNGLTETLSEVATGLNSLNLGNGLDGPESFTRAIWELANDTGIGWRSGSKRVAIAWFDNIPHDCDVYSLIGTPGISTGADPGRDGTAGTEDDLGFVATLDELKAQNISLITLFSGGTGLGFDLWQAASERTGGQAYLINGNGTIPDGSNIETFLADLIAEDLNSIDQLTVDVCDPTYAAWLSSPDVYTDIVLDEPISRDFDVTITPPAGTAPGVYEFELCLVGDGATYASTDVTITVPDNETEVAIDVHPTSCPNPVPQNSRGLTPVAISGSADFQVEDIDLSSITLEGIKAEMHSFEDASTPYFLQDVEELNENDCHTLGSDGIQDLSLKFDTQQLISAIGPVNKNDVLLVTLEGKLKDGTDFSGSDFIIIK